MRPISILPTAVVLSILLPLFSAHAAQSPSPSRSGHFVERELVHDGRHYPYAVFVPSPVHAAPSPEGDGQQKRRRGLGVQNGQCPV